MLLSYTFLDLAQQVRFTNVFEYSVAQTNPKIFDMKHDKKMQKYESATRPPLTLKGGGKSRSITNLLKFLQISFHV